MKILIGTNNEKKLAQFRRIFEMFGSGIEIFSLKEVGIADDVEEDADNLLDNAKKKAKFYAEVSRLLTLADDTGLFIDALNGEPGIHAKRWMGGTEKDRYLKVLERMKNVPREKRSCRYSGVLAVYNPADKKFWTHQSDIEGIIGDAPAAVGGFGYDAIFISTIFDKYFSQLTDEENFSIGHRGVGVKKLLKDLKLLSS